MEILVLSKIAKFAQNFLEMAKAKKATPKKAVVKKVAKPAAKSVKTTPKKAAKAAVKPSKKAEVKKAVKPAAKAAAKKVVKKVVAKPAPKKAVKVIAKAKKAVTKKVAAKKPNVKVTTKKVVAKPAPKKVVAKTIKKVVAKKAVKPTAKAPVKKVVKKAVAKPTPKKVVKPVVKAPVKSAPKVVAKPAPKNVAKPAPVVKNAPQKGTSKPISASGKQPKIKEKKVIREELPAKALISLPKSAVKKEEAKPTLIPQQLRYSDEELKEFKVIIDKKIESARDELNYLKESLENHTDSQEGNKAWNMEEGSDTTEMEYLMNQISRQNKFIRDLEMALVRIENKTYGVCRATGKLIDKNRLRIVPHATLSIEAKNSRKGDDIAPANSNTSAHMGSEGEGFGVDEN